MKAAVEDAQVAVVVDGEKRILTLQEAIALQASLAGAIQGALEQKIRMASSLLITPEDQAWQTTIAEIEWGSPQ